jgi:archaellum biogenesis ATPase FlaH
VAETLNFQDLTFQPKDVSLIRVSKQMSLTRALLIVLRKMIADGFASFLLLSDSPFEDLQAAAAEVGADLSRAIANKRLVVVDCVSRFKGRAAAADESEARRGVHYVSSPSDLAEIALKLSDAISSAKPPGEKWLVIDSLTAMTMYNSVGGILRFMQFLFQKLGMLNFEGVVVVVGEESRDSMVSELRRYCGKIIFLASD